MTWTNDKDSKINLAWGASYWLMFRTYNGLHIDAQETLTYIFMEGFTEGRWQNITQCSVWCTNNVVLYNNPFGRSQNTRNLI